MTEHEMDEVDFDVDAQDAQLREALGKTVKVKFQEHTLEFEPVKAWSQDALNYLEAGQYVAWIEELHPDFEFDPPIKPYQAEAILEFVSKKNGLTVGKSSPPSKRSRNTRKR